MDVWEVGIEQLQSPKSSGVSGRRVAGVLLLAALLVALPALPEEFQLASLEGRWLPVTSARGTSPSGLKWEIRSGAGSGGDFRRLTLTRKGQEVFTWNGNSDELVGSLRIYHDQDSSEPRFLCYQPLTTGPHTHASEVRLGIWLVDGESCRPIVTNLASQLLRNPSALLGWGGNKTPDYSAEAGLLDQP